MSAVLGRGVLAANAAAVVVWVATWVHLGMQGEFWRADFTAFYAGWRVLLDGRGEEFYSLEVQEEYQHAAAPERAETGGILPQNHPPHGFLFAPLALLSLTGAFYTWAVLNLLFLARVLYLVGDLLAETQPPPLPVILTILAFPALFAQFQLGQMALWALLCQLAWLRAWRRGNDIETAFWLVLATLKPQWSVAPAFLLLGARQWRTLGLAGIFFAIWACITMVVVNPRCWLEFLDAVGRSSQQSGALGIFPDRMYNLKCVFYGFLGPEEFPLVNTLSAVAWVLGLGLVAWLGRAGPADDHRVGLALLIGALVNPHFNPADALCVLLPGLLLYKVALVKGWRWYPGLALAVPWVFFVDCYLGVTGPWGLRPFILLMVGCAIWAAIALRRTANDRDPLLQNPKK